MANHRCPATGCGVHMPTSLLMCRQHWALVPKPLQRAVYTAWAGGKGAGSEGHRQAIDAAIQAVNAQLPGRSP